MVLIQNLNKFHFQTSTSKSPPNISILTKKKGVIYQGIADSAQTEYCTTFHSSVRPSVRVFVTGVTSHIYRIYKGINAMLIIRGPIKPYIFRIKIILAIFLAKTRPDKTIFSALTNFTIDFDRSKELSKR